MAGIERENSGNEGEQERSILNDIVTDALTKFQSKESYQTKRLNKEITVAYMSSDAVNDALEQINHLPLELLTQIIPHSI